MFLKFLKVAGIMLSTMLLALVILGFSQTWQVQHSPNQELFVKGTIPDPLPQGLYNGSIGIHEVSWLGKTFNSQMLSGINMFVGSDGKLTQKYPFKTSTGRGLLDKNVQVLKIDYNTHQNPLLVQMILDEIVQTSDNTYLGKVIVRVIPGFPFAIGYFELTR